MKIIKILTVLVLFPALLSAQNVRKNIADTYFGYLSYAKAAPIYEELAKSSVKKSKRGKPVDWEMVRRAAESNFYTRNYAKAVYWYDVLAVGKAATKEDYMMYFESLRYIGNYTKANTFLDSLHKLDPADAKVKEYIRQANYFNFLKKDSANYKVQVMPFNKNVGDFAPAFYDQGLVYTSANRKGSIGNKYDWDNTSFLNVYYVKKNGTELEKKSKLLKKSFKSTAHDGPVFYSKDGNTAIFTRNRKERNKKRGEFVVLNLYTIQKSADGKWGELQPFQYNSINYSVGHAALSPDEQTLYFASDMPGGMGGVDIWKCEKQGAGWAAPVNLGKTVNTPDNEMFPYVSPEGNLYFASKGHVGLGGLDIFESRKSAGGFMAPVNMGYPINTHFDDFAMITQDGKLAYFSSDRTDYIDRILGVQMPNRIIFNLEGKVFNQLAKTKVIPGAEVVVKNITLGDSIVTTANDSGQFFIPLLSESDYVLTVTKDKFKPVSPVNLTTKGLTESKTLTANLFLVPSNEPKNEPITNPEYVADSLGNKTELIRPRENGEALLVIKVVDCETDKPIVGVKLQLQDLETRIISHVKTNSNGELIVRQPTRDLPIGREFAVINEALEMGADGSSYVPSVKKTYFILKGSEPNLTVTKTICLTQLKEGDEFELKDIYYDLDKATLRPLSIVQLDRAYDFLMRNRNIKLELSSHTDSRASNEYNQNLSQRRAQACVDYLVKVKGVPSGRIVAKGYGETKLTNQCADGVSCTEEEHQLNRRTEIRVLKTN